MSEEIHDLDLRGVIQNLPDAEILVLMYDAIAVLTCEDSGLQERCEEALKLEAYIEKQVGPVHWMRMACCEGECDVCEAHHG